MATSAALTQSTSCRKNLAMGPKRAFHCCSTATTQMLPATPQPMIRATSIDTHRSRTSGTTTRITVITVQTTTFAMMKTTRETRSAMTLRSVIADNPYNRSVEPQAPSKLHINPIYETFYGLTEQPFAISTDPRFLYMSTSHERAYEELLTGLRRDEGLLLLTGEAGTGKTTLCRAVIDALGERTFSCIVLNPYMTGAELLKVVLRDFGLVSRDELRSGALARADAVQLMDTLEGFLLTVRSVDSRAILVVDEAQSLAPAVLDQVRLLTALERNGRRLIQVVLGAQPALLQTLKKDSLYALNERISRRVFLAPLTGSEIKAYIEHRLAVAGGKDKVSFNADAISVVTALARGLPRRVNLLCDRALQVGLAERVTVIGPEIVSRAARSLSGGAGSGSAPPASQRPDDDDAPVIVTTLPSRSRRTRRLAVAAAGTTMLLLAGGLGYGYYAQQTLAADPGVPAAPPAPTRDIGEPAPAKTAPSQADLDEWLKLMSIGG
jgi:general secretion pathway protein A